jgi:hypothetical protein
MIKFLIVWGLNKMTKKELQLQAFYELKKMALEKVEITSFRRGNNRKYDSITSNDKNCVKTKKKGIIK